MASGLTDSTTSSKASIYYDICLESCLRHQLGLTHLEVTDNGKLKLISKLLLHECPFGHRPHGPDHSIAPVDEDLHNPGRDKAIRTSNQGLGMRLHRGHDSSSENKCTGKRKGCVEDTVSITAYV